MGNFLHRTTKDFLRSVSPNDLPEPLANYIEDPDLSGVVDVSPRYWNITGDVITEMSQGEKDAVDVANVSGARDAAMQGGIDNLESVQRQVVQLMLRELNILRALHGLPDRTMAQVRTQIRNDLGS